MGEMNDERLAFENGKRALIGESSTMKLLRGKQGLLEDKFNAKMTWLAGKAQIAQGNLDRADKIVAQYFDNAIADREERISNLETLFTLSNNKLIKLTDEEKSLAKEQMALLADMNQRQQDEKNAIRELMIDPTTAVAWDKAGVDMSMPLDEILQKITPFISQAEKARLYAKNNVSGGTTHNGFTNSKAEDEARGNLIGLLQEYRTNNNDQTIEIGNADFYNWAMPQLKLAAGGSASEEALNSLFGIDPAGLDEDEQFVDELKTEFISGTSFLSSNIAETKQGIPQVKAEATRLRQIISGLTGASVQEINKAKKELRAIPQILEGERIHFGS